MRRTDSGLVRVALLTSRDRQILALQTMRSFISTTVVLGANSFDERRQHYTVDRLTQRIEHLRYRVFLKPVAVPAVREFSRQP